MIDKTKLIVCSCVSAIVMLETAVGLYKNDKKTNHEEELCFITKITNNLNHQMNAIKNGNSDVKKVEYIKDYEDMEYYTCKYDENGNLIKEDVTRIPTLDGLKLDSENIIMGILKEKYPALKIYYMDKDMFVTEEKVLKLEKKY